MFYTNHREPYFKLSRTLGISHLCALTLQLGCSIIFFSHRPLFGAQFTSPHVGDAMSKWNKHIAVKVTAPDVRSEMSKSKPWTEMLAWAEAGVSKSVDKHFTGLKK